MKAHLFSLLLFVPLALAGLACQGAPEPDTNSETTPLGLRELIAKAAETEQPLLIHFHAEW